MNLCSRFWIKQELVLPVSIPPQRLQSAPSGETPDQSHPWALTIHLAIHEAPHCSKMGKLQLMCSTELKEPAIWFTWVLKRITAAVKSNKWEIRQLLRHLTTLISVKLTNSSLWVSRCRRQALSGRQRRRRRLRIQPQRALAFFCSNLHLSVATLRWKLLVWLARIQISTLWKKTTGRRSFLHKRQLTLHRWAASTRLSDRETTPLLILNLLCIRSARVFYTDKLVRSVMLRLKAASGNCDSGIELW